MPQGQPAVELVTGNGKTFADTFHTTQPCKVFCKDTEDKEKPVTGIRNDEIRKDSMCMPAGADKAKNTEIMADRLPADKVNDGALIIGVDTTGTLGTAAGTGSKLRTESCHKGVKKGFR